MEIVIQELPEGIHKALKQAAIRAGMTAYSTIQLKKITIKFDHFDTMHDVLNRFKKEISNNWGYNNVEFNSLYGLDEDDNTFCFLQGNLLVNELQKLPQHQRNTIYCSDFTFQELEENKRNTFEDWKLL